MNIAILGGTGFIGSALIKGLLHKQHQVVLFTRHPHKNSPQHQGVTVSPWPIEENRSIVVDAVINLAGETINQRWTPRAKENILQSRVLTTQKLVELIGQGRIQTSTLINGSAIGIYGHDETRWWTETDQPIVGDDDFLASVVQAWERVADQIEAYNIRCVKARLGVVLGSRGGALPKMLTPYRFFAGGCVGKGTQPVSWIHIEDVVGLFLHILNRPEIRGVVNFTSPSPVTMDELGRQIGKVMRRPYWLPVPEFALKILLGEMSDLLLKGQKVIPKQALETNYCFAFPTIESSLKNLLV